VRLVSTGMISAFTRLGPAGADGLRPWIGEAPAGTLDHADARSARTILHVAPAGPEMDAYPDTC
jgi:hypothetical protein